MNKIDNQGNTQLEVIPAQPGWYVLNYDNDDDFRVWKEPIVAWVVNLRRLLRNRHERISVYASPVIPEMSFVDDDVIILAPDGQVFSQEEVECWDSVDDWIKYEKYKLLEKALEQRQP